MNPLQKPYEQNVQEQLPLQALPAELLTQIILFLTDRECAQLGATCQYFHTFVNALFTINPRDMSRLEIKRFFQKQLEEDCRVSGKEAPSFLQHITSAYPILILHNYRNRAKQEELLTRTNNRLDQLVKAGIVMGMPLVGGSFFLFALKYYLAGGILLGGGFAAFSFTCITCIIGCGKEVKIATHLENLRNSSPAVTPQPA